jgi:predicted transcriptional regulator
LADSPTPDLRGLTADIVAAHAANNKVSLAELPTLISSVHGALARAGASAGPEAPPQEPAVSIRSSVKPDYIVSLESGKKMKMLKRYLMTNYGMTPEDYRRKWGLPRDYPMVAPNYAEQRRGLAKKIGLGRSGRKVVKAITDGAGKAVAAVADTVAPKKSGRPKAKAATKPRAKKGTASA